jgi:hypothetical protein
MPVKLALAVTVLLHANVTKHTLIEVGSSICSTDWLVVLMAFAFSYKDRLTLSFI